MRNKKNNFLDSHEICQKYVKTCPLLNFVVLLLLLWNAFVHLTLGMFTYVEEKKKLLNSRGPLNTVELCAGECVSIGLKFRMGASIIIHH